MIIYILISYYIMSRKEIDKKIMAQEKREHTIARQKYGTPECKKGQVVREGYFKSGSKKGYRYGTWVAPTCITATGNAKKTGKKGSKLFRVNKGTLSQFGYTNIKQMSKKERRDSLKKAISTIDPLTVRRKLIAVSTLQKNTNPKLSQMLKDDSEWVKKQIKK